jgi:hypothetical protein
MTNGALLEARVHKRVDHRSYLACFSDDLDFTLASVDQAFEVYERQVGRMQCGGMPHCMATPRSNWRLGCAEDFGLTG